MTWMSPVALQKMWPILAASAMGMTRKPSITASSARSGSIFGDDHVGAHALGAHGDALAAPAVAADDEVLARQQHVGGADNAVDRALPGAVAVVKEMLGLRVVDGNHREAAACPRRPWRAGG